ncbi:MAG TPA: YfbM family protein [Pseudonocardiaceae bacterium]
MGTNAEYARVTPTELRRALHDPEWAYEHVRRLVDAAETDPSGADRVLDLDRSWEGLRLLLVRHGTPVDLLLEGTVFAADDDWGNGPPRCLTPRQVRRVARFLDTTPFDRLVAAAGPEATSRTDTPQSTVEAGDLDHLRTAHRELVRFFRIAAAAGDAVLLRPS